MKLIFQKPSLHQHIFVGETRGVRFLRFGGKEAGWQGAISVKQPEMLYFPYQQAFSLYPAWKTNVRRFLSLGVGTGTAISHVYKRHPKAEIVGVEWDNTVLQVAADYFYMPTDKRVRLVQADARSYVTRMEELFDLIYIDVYFQEETPRVIFSQLYLSIVADLLEPGGVLAINAIAATKGPLSDPFTQLCADLQAIVGPTYTISLSAFPYTTHNVILFAQRTPVRVQSLSQIRTRGWKEIQTHTALYPWTARVLPWLIKNRHYQQPSNSNTFSGKRV